MPYIVRLFDTLPVPELIQRGNTQNMGTGRALTSFLPLPGGGWYNNYRGKKTPQGIRPITKSGVFTGTSAELRQAILDWRAMLGEFKKLTIEWDSGELMWQWATLQDVDAPRPDDAVCNWGPFTLTWITAAQNWRSVVYGPIDWTVGDDTFVINDGAAEIETGAQIFYLFDSDETITVNHGGSIDAPNVTLRFAISGSWQDVTIVNETTGQQIVVNRSTNDTTPMWEINAGARSIYAGRVPVTIHSALRSLNTLQVTTGAHTLVNNDSVRISGTGIYDGDYYPVTVTDTVTFTVPLAPDFAGYGTVTNGIAQGLVSAYNVTTFSDKSRWLVLAPGDNVLRFVWAPFPTSVALTVEFVDHYG